MKRIIEINFPLKNYFIPQKEGDVEEEVEEEEKKNSTKKKRFLPHWKISTYKIRVYNFPESR